MGSTPTGSTRPSPVVYWLGRWVFNPEDRVRSPVGLLPFLGRLGALLTNSLFSLRSKTLELTDPAIALRSNSTGRVLGCYPRSWRFEPSLRSKDHALLAKLANAAGSNPVASACGFNSHGEYAVRFAVRMLVGPPGPVRDPSLRWLLCLSVRSVRSGSGRACCRRASSRRT